MHLIYRKLVPSESKKYREIRLLSLKESPDDFGASYEEEKQIESLAFEKYIEEENVGKFIMGAFMNHSLIGICGFLREEQKKASHKGTLIQMFLCLEFQKKGFGAKLLASTIEEIFKIPEIEQIALGVISTNIPAIKIYEKAGFVEYGFQRNYFKNDQKYQDQKLMILYR